MNAADGSDVEADDPTWGTSPKDVLYFWRPFTSLDRRAEVGRKMLTVVVVWFVILVV
ncbi:MAG: hypothetical protein HKN94_01635, partial [Acidimicrobiales bacterium]|nr:hypothetical protein [Acidimicrobiales bacterium]